MRVCVCPRFLARFATRVLRPCCDRLVGRPQPLRRRIQSLCSPNGTIARGVTAGWAPDGRPSLDPSSQPPQFTAFSRPPQISAMTDNSRQPKEQDGVLSTLNVAIDGLNIAKEIASVTPAKAVFGSVAVLLTMIRVSRLLSCDEIFQIHTSPGHDDQRSGLCRSRAVLC